MKRRVWLTLLVPSVALADPPHADLPTREVSLLWDSAPVGQELLHASFSYRDLVDRKTEEQLQSGLPVTLSLRVYVLREGQKEPIALSVRSCRVVYDLWDEVYRIKIVAPESKPKPDGKPVIPERNAAAVSVDGVLRQCAEAKTLPIVSRGVLVPRVRYFLGVLAEVNPVSPQMQDEMRRWVTRPPGATGIGPQDALFGSFALLFVRDLAGADRTVRFRSRSFVAKE